MSETGTNIGLFCSWCGVEFEAPHGHAVLCKSCFTEKADTDYASLPEAIQPEVWMDDGEYEDGPDTEPSAEQPPTPPIEPSK